MKINIRADSVEIEGYVNAVERNSKPLMSRIGQFIERVCKGAFNKALHRNNNVHVLLNHDWARDLGSTSRGNLELSEDNIGLHARATITDPEVIEKARKGQLTGWSFGFKDIDVERGEERGMLLRQIHDLDLREVSILDNTKTPAYEGTLIMARSDDGEEELYNKGEDFIDEVIIREEGGEQQPTETEETKTETEPEVKTEPVENPVDKSVENIDKIDYSNARNMIKEMKGEQ